MSADPALAVLHRMGGEVAEDELARKLSKRELSVLDALVAGGLVVEHRYLQVTEKGIERLRRAGLACKRCRRSLQGVNEDYCGSCQAGVDECRRRRDRERSRERRAADPTLPTKAERRRELIAARDAEIVRLRVEDHLGTKAIAGRLGISYWIVNGAFARARQGGAEVPKFGPQGVRA